MNATAGWNIWGNTGDRVRQFTVATPSEADAMATLRAKHPEVEIISRHTMAAATINFLRMAEGQVVEWVRLEANGEGGITPGGVPIDKPMK